MFGGNEQVTSICIPCVSMVLTFVAKCSEVSMYSVYLFKVYLSIDCCGHCIGILSSMAMIVFSGEGYAQPLPSNMTSATQQIFNNKFANSLQIFEQRIRKQFIKQTTSSRIANLFREPSVFRAPRGTICHSRLARDTELPNLETPNRKCL